MCFFCGAMNTLDSSGSRSVVVNMDVGLGWVVINELKCNAKSSC